MSCSPTIRWQRRARARRARLGGAQGLRGARSSRRHPAGGGAPALVERGARGSARSGSTTPRLPGPRRCLVESARGDKQPAPPSAALRAAAEQRLAPAGWWLPRRWRRRRSCRSRRSRRRRRASRGRSRRARRRSSRSAGRDARRAGDAVARQRRRRRRRQRSSQRRRRGPGSRSARGGRRPPAARATAVRRRRGPGARGEGADDDRLPSAPAAAHRRRRGPRRRPAPAIGGDAVKGTAAGILNPRSNAANQRAIVAAGAIRRSSPRARKGRRRRSRCFALWNLACQHAENQVALARAGAVAPLVALLSKGPPSLQEEAAAR